ncbi:hypothetical protein LJR277_002100 [Pseudomonas sp. LjRoot277]|uniref:hypothetical protein n=1 Tax=Pseudomonas sp. LjRoot277 TaxID=3342307 RepID=UPI003ECFE100
MTDIDKDFSNWPAHLRKIYESKGMRFLNDQKMRSFSLNILYMNATSLVEEAEKLSDPDIGIELMFVSNKDAGDQAHREINRHIHNFVAAAKTVVDHTRVMLNEKYIETQIHQEINKRIVETVGASPVCKFVHDLRNFMVHKGLPNSEMYMQCSNVGPDGAMHFKTGVRIKATSLLDFKSWTAPALKYIKQAGDYVEIDAFTKQYVDEVKALHSWLDIALTQYHASDLAELAELQAEESEHSAERVNTPISLDTMSPIETSVEVLENSAKIFIDSLALKIFSKIRIHEIAVQKESSFKSMRPAVELNDQSAMKTAIVTSHNHQGEQVTCFIHKKQGSFGLLEAEFDMLNEAYQRIAQEAWVVDRFDLEFVTDIFIFWARESFDKSEKLSFYDYLQSRSVTDITRQDVIFPIAHLEVESSFEFGPVTITPIALDFFDGIEQMMPSEPQEAVENSQRLVDDLKKRYLGLAAVKVSMEVHESLISTTAFALAGDAVDLLRFFAPNAFMGAARYPTALSGTEYLPRKQILTLSGSKFSVQDGLMPEFYGNWRLSNNQLSELRERNLEKAGTLLISGALNNFAKSIRTAIIMFSKGSTMISLVDRLHYTLSAAEEILLQHRVEAVESCLSSRISFLIAEEAGERARIQESIRKAYGLKNQYKSINLNSEIHAINLCIAGVYDSILTALANIENFETTKAFVIAVDQRGGHSHS